MLRQRSGVFVAIDGPKTAGKSTLLELVVPILQARGLSVLATKEPTPSFNLTNEEHYTGIELATLLANDRRQHVAKTIVPGLATHDAVITDRYISSSLGFQVLDGVPFEKVWSLNKDFILPDLNVFLMASEAVIERRRKARPRLTRFEREICPGDEIALYSKIKKHMEKLCVRTVTITNNDNRRPEVSAQNIADAITKRREEVNE